MKPILLIALLLPLAASAARHPSSQEDGSPSRGTLNCAMTEKSGKKSTFSFALNYYEDKNMGEGEEDGAAGKTTFHGYTIRYETAAGSVPCRECRTGATKAFNSTLTLSKAGRREEANGGAFADLELQPKAFPDVKSLSCQYQPAGSPDDDKL